MATNPSAAQAREILRREHGVRVVTRAEEGFAADQLPPGVFGFTSSPALASPLFAVRHYRNFEIHRLPNGTAVIGFVTPEEAARLTHAQVEVVIVTIFPDAEGDATAIVAVSYDRVAQHRQYSIRNAASITLQVSPAREPAVTALTD